MGLTVTPTARREVMKSDFKLETIMTWMPEELVGMKESFLYKDDTAFIEIQRQ
jgi:hypothetical protein